MNISLSSIRTGRVPDAPRITIYGVGGVGKSSFAAQAPNPVFMDIEDGLSEIDCHKISLRNGTFDDVCAAIKLFVTEDHPYQTVVIDALDALEMKIWDKVCRGYTKPVQSIEEIGYAKGYIFALNHWKFLLEGLEALRSRGIQVILLAHSQVTRIEDPAQDQPYDKHAMKLHKKAAALIHEWSDCVLYCDFHTVLRETKTGKVKALSSGDRLMYCKESPAYEAKSRFQLPDVLPLSYAELAQAIETSRQQPN